MTRDTPFIGPRSSLLVLACIATTSAVVAQAPLVTIESVNKRGNQYYDWTVKNNHTSPIVFVEFPHYHADQFEAPERWEVECENLFIAGAIDTPGFCRATAPNPLDGIQPGRAMPFGMRVSRTGADRRPGTVLIRFADGQASQVTGVLLPTAKSFWEQNILGIGLAVIFGGFMLIHFLRRRKSPAKASVADGVEST